MNRRAEGPAVPRPGVVHLFFGEMGSGKSWCAERWAKYQGLTFFEGDSVVTRELLDRSGRFKPIPRGVIREFVKVLAQAIIDKAGGGDIVVSQALYLDEDRLWLESILAEHHLAVHWVWVKTGFFMHVRNLLTRKERWRWVGYWLMNTPFFQKPSHKHEVFRNVAK